jgi:hypothetical protein
MWLIDSAAGSSKAALVSSICCKFVCRSLPATQQPNMGYGSRASGSTASHDHDHPGPSSTGLTNPPRSSGLLQGPTLDRHYTNL